MKYGNAHSCIVCLQSRAVILIKHYSRTQVTIYCFKYLERLITYGTMKQIDGFPETPRMPQTIHSQK